MNSKGKASPILCIAAIVATILSIPIMLSALGVFPWPAINCRSYELDIQTGRIRYTRYIWYIAVSRHVEETAISRVLSTEDLQGLYPEWRPIATTSPGTRSPYLAFHTATTQIAMLEAAWEEGEFTAEARLSSAKSVLALWQQGQCARAADSFVHQTFELVGEASMEKAGERGP